MIFYHRTNKTTEILANGFEDQEGTYLTGQVWRGVWLSDYPLDANEGAKGKDLLSIEIPEEVLLKYEWVEDEKPYREFLVPAALVNSYGPPQLIENEDDIEMWY